MDDHEAAAADIAGAGIGHGQCEADGDCGVDRVAAAVEDLDADARGALFLRHHHAVVREDRLLPAEPAASAGFAHRKQRGKRYDETIEPAHVAL